MADVMMLLLKGLTGAVVVFMILVVLLAIAHLQDYIRRNYPRVDLWGKRIVSALIISIITFGSMMLLGMVVESFFWR